ncbi:MAG: tRNA pseudouridine(55) synthase TruB [Flavobacteriaceae bacterium]|nr:tRNA pseudouridine(55) synthase TruB [Flavobacteriaceae bacterium]
MENLNPNARAKGEIILINKPYGWSSFQAVKKIKYVTKAKKVGHAGTLDPLASGLLIICTEQQTKGIQVIQDAEKVYEGTIKLGVTTPSYDLETEPNALFETGHITQALIEKILPQFVGELEQIPPVYSAIKVDGRRAYALARQGEEPVLKSRKISIYAFEITAIEIPNIDFRVRCSKGTYIRTLAFDFGKALESGACLSSLVRTKIGNYSLDNALTPHEFEEVFKRRNKQDSGDPIRPI